MSALVDSVLAFGPSFLIASFTILFMNSRFKSSDIFADPTFDFMNLFQIS